MGIVHIFFAFSDHPRHIFWYDDQFFWVLSLINRRPSRKRDVLCKYRLAGWISNNVALTASHVVYHRLQKRILFSFVHQLEPINRSLWKYSLFDNSRSRKPKTNAIREVPYKAMNVHSKEGVGTGLILEIFTMNEETFLVSTLTLDVHIWTLWIATRAFKPHALIYVQNDCLVQQVVQEIKSNAKFSSSWGQSQPANILLKTFTGLI